MTVYLLCALIFRTSTRTIRYSNCVGGNISVTINDVVFMKTGIVFNQIHNSAHNWSFTYD